ncbi:hypothetical protein DFH06DRAFT_105810 [Mycena polygramma]|nr:hypothetical protein DFH06DRAFT_105810 [Mycena polygramma]
MVRSLEDLHPVHVSPSPSPSPSTTPTSMARPRFPSSSLGWSRPGCASCTSRTHLSAWTGFRLTRRRKCPGSSPRASTAAATPCARFFPSAASSPGHHGQTGDNGLSALGGLLRTRHGRLEVSPPYRHERYHWAKTMILRRCTRPADSSLFEGPHPFTVVVRLPSSSDRHDRLGTSIIRRGHLSGHGPLSGQCRACPADAQKPADGASSWSLPTLPLWLAHEVGQAAHEGAGPGISKEGVGLARLEGVKAIVCVERPKDSFAISPVTLSTISHSPSPSLSIRSSFPVPC